MGEGPEGQVGRLRLKVVQDSSGIVISRCRWVGGGGGGVRSKVTPVSSFDSGKIINSFCVC